MSALMQLDISEQCDIDAEQSVLGSVMIDHEVLADVAEVIKTNDFFREGHRLIFEAFESLAQRGEPIDTITVLAELRSNNADQTIGGASYLIALLDAVPTSVNAVHYAKIVRDKSIRRALRDRARDILEACHDQDRDVESIIEQVSSIPHGLEYRDSSPFVPIGQCAYDAYTQSTDGLENNVRMLGIESGFDELDVITDGWQAGELIVAAGRPGSGKSVFMLNCAVHAAAVQNKKAALFSLEMGPRQTTNRVLSAKTSLSGRRLRKGWIDPDDWIVYDRAVQDLSNVPLYLSTSFDMTPRKIKSEALWLRRHVGLDIIFIDYLQLLDQEGDRATQNRVQEISKYTRFLKNLAGELQVPIVLLSQLSREVEKRENKRPMLSDLRDSGSIEQDADIVIFLYRESYYKTAAQKQLDGEDAIDECEVIVAKNREGRTDMVRLAFQGNYARFTPVPGNGMGGTGF